MTTPTTAVPPSTLVPRLTRAMPRNPTAMPHRCGPRGVRWNHIAPISPVKNGVAPLSRPVTAELMCSSASGNSVNGIATHTIDSRTSDRRSAGAIGVRAPGRKTRAAAPRPTRAQVISPGWKAPRATLMRRNEEPHISPIGGEEEPVDRGERLAVRSGCGQGLGGGHVWLGSGEPGTVVGVGSATADTSPIGFAIVQLHRLRFTAFPIENPGEGRSVAW